MDGQLDQLGLLAARGGDFSGALLESVVGLFDDEQQVADVRPGVVLALVPAFGTLLQRFVVAHLVVLYQALQADVAPDVDAREVTGLEQQQAGDAAVAVAEGMDAEEVEVEGGQQDKRRDDAFADEIGPEAGQRAGTRGRLGRRNAAETDALVAIGQTLDDVDRLVLVLPGIPDLAAAKLVQVEDGLLRDRKLCAALVDQVQGVAVARDLLLVPVLEGGTPENDGSDARLVDLHALDAVGRDDALRDGMFPQYLQTLGRLTLEQILKALGASNVRKIP